MTDLPDNCLWKILLYVPAGERFKLRQVSKQWCKVVDDCWRAVTTITIVGPSITDERPQITGTGNTIKIVSPLRNVLERIMENRGQELFCAAQLKEPGGLPFYLDILENFMRRKGERFVRTAPVKRAGFTVLAKDTDELPTLGM